MAMSARIALSNALNGLGAMALTVTPWPVSRMASARV